MRSMEFTFSILASLLAGFFLFKPWIVGTGRDFKKENEASSMLAQSLKKEEIVEALTELEVDFRNDRMSEPDYLAARRDLSLLLSDEKQV